VADANRKHRRQWRDYRTRAGGRPVKTFLNALTDEEVAAIVAGMKEVAANGLPVARHLLGEIYEVRADASTRSFRLLFSAEGRYSQVLLSLSVFEKRTQKTPPDKIKLAESRLSDWRQRGAELRKTRKKAGR
jgi:phage-related protein